MMMTMVMVMAMAMAGGGGSVHVPSSQPCDISYHRQYSKRLSCKLQIVCCESVCASVFIGMKMMELSGLMADY